MTDITITSENGARYWQGLENVHVQMDGEYLMISATFPPLEPPYLVG